MLPHYHQDGAEQCPSSASTREFFQYCPFIVKLGKLRLRKEEGWCWLRVCWTRRPCSGPPLPNFSLIHACKEPQISPPLQTPADESALAMAVSFWLSCFRASPSSQTLFSVTGHTTLPPAIPQNMLYFALSSLTVTSLSHPLAKQSKEEQHENTWVTPAPPSCEHVLGSPLQLAPVPLHLGSSLPTLSCDLLPPSLHSSVLFLASAEWGPGLFEAKPL